MSRPMKTSLHRAHTAHMETIGISRIAKFAFFRFLRGHSAAGAPPARSREQTLWQLPSLVSSGALPSEESLRAKLALLARWTRAS